ncbi:MAG: hypothetical protein V8S34_09000 [Lawsonibacter sp.]
MLCLGSCAGNLAGALANAAIHGLSLPTLFCFCCMLAVFALSAFGCVTRRCQPACYALLFVLVFVEFPALVLYLWRAHHALSDPGHRGAGHLHPPPAGRTAGYPGLCLGPVRHVHGPSLPRPAGAGDGGRRLQLRPVYLHHRGLLPVCHHRAAERAAGAPGRPAHPAQRPVRARRRPRLPDPAV